MLLQGYRDWVIDCAAVDNPWLAGPVLRAEYPCSWQKTPQSGPMTMAGDSEIRRYGAGHGRVAWFTVPHENG